MTAPKPPPGRDNVVLTAVFRPTSEVRKVGPPDNQPRDVVECVRRASSAKDFRSSALTSPSGIPSCCRSKGADPQALFGQVTDAQWVATSAGCSVRANPEPDCCPEHTNFQCCSHPAALRSCAACFDCASCNTEAATTFPGVRNHLKR
jgi:hypothetical protein